MIRPLLRLLYHIISLLCVIFKKSGLIMQIFLNGGINLLQFPTDNFPSGVTIDGTVNNTFSFVFRGDILSKYQITIYNNSTGTTVYTGSEVTVTKYNEQTVSAVIPSGSFTNAYDYVWTVKLWDTSGKTITSPSNFFKARKTPTLTLNAITSPLVVRKAVSNGTYTQAQSTPIQYHSWYLYDGDGNIVESIEKIYSAYLHYEFEGLVSGNSYKRKLVVLNQDNVEVTAEDSTAFTVSYPAPDLKIKPSVEFLDDKNAIEVSWVEDRQSVGYSTGTYSFVTNVPFTGTNSVNIQTGEIVFDKVSGKDMLLKNDSYTVFISTTITQGKQGKIIEINIDNKLYYLEVVGNNFVLVTNGASTIIGTVLSNTVSGLTATGVPASDTYYVWSDADVWNDSYYWTETASFTKRFAIVVLPAEMQIYELI